MHIPDGCNMLDHIASDLSTNLLLVEVVELVEIFSIILEKKKKKKEKEACHTHI
jgi:hypothetical protein